MADQVDDKGDGAEAPEPRACTVCRGTGTVISNLGGTPAQQDCPWCEGTGTEIPGHDAQAREPVDG